MSNQSSSFLPVMEHFYTIQGEGFHSGRPAYFVRLEGCDVGCVWCDVKESWEIETEDFRSVDSIVEDVLSSGTEFCVITGGEPCMHDLSELTEKLKNVNIITALETSGCYELKGKVDWYCFSPKKFKAPIDEAYTLANELKVVINHPSDFEFAEKHASRVSESCKLYLQPEWSKQERFLSTIIDYVKQNPKWRISLQTHKFMNIP
jgi:organic radical activating enzyme